MCLFGNIVMSPVAPLRTNGITVCGDCLSDGSTALGTRRHVCACLGALETALYRDMGADVMSELGVSSQPDPASSRAESGLAILLGGERMSHGLSCYTLSVFVMRAAARIRSWGSKQLDYVNVRDVAGRDARTAVDKGEP